MASIAESKAETKLMDEFQKLLVAHRVAFGQERCFRRFVALTMAMVFCFGRRTITQMLLTLGLTDTDHSAMYRLFSRKRFKEEVLWRCLFAETLQHVGEDALYVVGTDATQIPRSGWHIAGVGWLKSAKSPAFKPGIHAAQRFVHGCWLTPMVNGFSRAIPLRFVPAFTEKAKRGDEEPCKEWEAGLKYVRWVRKEMDAVRPGQRILWLADGGLRQRGIVEGNASADDRRHAHGQEPSLVRISAGVGTAGQSQVWREEAQSGGIHETVA